MDIATNFAGAQSLVAVDIDGDGDIDLAAQNYNGVAWWENTEGDGSAWSFYPVDQEFPNGTSLHARDLDGDGDAD